MFIEIYLVRHGKTDWNAQGILQGHQDIPLNQEGEHLTLVLEQKLRHIPFAKAITSDLVRAKKRHNYSVT